MRPDDALFRHFRLLPPQREALKRLGLYSVRDLLYHFPARYETPSEEGQAGALVPGAKVALWGTLSGIKARKLWKSRRNVAEGWFEDASGRVKVMWFNQPYIASYVPQGKAVRVTGVVGGSREKPYIANPEVGTAEGAEEHAPKSGTRLFPVYPESRGVTSRWLLYAVRKVLESEALRALEDPIPAEVRKRYHLPDLPTALVWIHAPKRASHHEAARKRFSFEEMLALQVARAKERSVNDAQSSYPVEEALPLARRFLDSLPFPPTKAQRRAVSEIAADLGKPSPMARLLEGDVGSGKTLVAAAASYAVVHARAPGRASGTLQVAYMAPTELLAQQHFQSFVEYFRHLPISIALLTGSGCKKFPSKVSPDRATDISRAQLLKWVAGGEIAMVVGTHALIQKSVRFQHLALVIVDEQHRFGTAQRRALARKSDLSADAQAAQQVPAPHFLSMTATPIPRTLALSMYGDLDLSVLDELPPARAKIETFVVDEKTRNDAYERMREELAQGRQAYVICPRIEEPDPSKWNALQAKSAKAEAARLQKEVFPERTVGLLHGSMRPAEKDAVMRRFVEGDIQVLVATSVVEVGVDVPNATSIMIEGAERFGLAQLHQLRGRVMRSAHPPRCFLAAEHAGEAARKRLKALARSSDGFELAEADLKARGAGDLWGRRQWGITDLGMNALKNPTLIRAAREEARALLARDPELLAHPALRARLFAREELHGE